MLDAYRDLIDELLETPTEIRSRIDAAGEAAPPADAIRVIAELRDRDRAVLERAQIMTREAKPYLRDLQPGAPPDDVELPVLLEEMESARGDLVSLLINLSLKDWERIANHETEGEVTLAEEIERHVDFDEAQRQRLRELFASS